MYFYIQKLWWVPWSQRRGRRRRRATPRQPERDSQTGKYGGWNYRENMGDLLSLRKPLVCQTVLFTCFVIFGQSRALLCKVMLVSLYQLLVQLLCFVLKKCNIFLHYDNHRICLKRKLFSSASIFPFIFSFL